MNVPNSMQAAALPAWEFGNPCSWRRHPHGNLGIHAGGGVARMGIWGIHAGGGVTCMGIWESMQAAASPAWEFGESMQAAASPAWRRSRVPVISRQTALQNGEICRSPNKFE